MSDNMSVISGRDTNKWSLPFCLAECLLRIQDRTRTPSFNSPRYLIRECCEARVPVNISGISCWQNCHFENGACGIVEIMGEKWNTLPMIIASTMRGAHYFIIYWFLAHIISSFIGFLDECSPTHTFLACLFSSGLVATRLYRSLL